MAGSRERRLTGRLAGSTRPDEWSTARDSGPKLLVAALAGLLVASVLSAVLLTAWGIDWRASLSFPTDDGWCSIRSEAISGHCWGDFAGIRFASIGSHPSEAEALYPLSTRVPRLPFAALDWLAGFRVALAAWLACLLACALAPIVWATQRMRLRVRVPSVLVCGALTLPTIVILDRGNLIGLVVPAILLFAVGVVRDRPVLAVTGLIACAAIKPQFVLLGVVLIGLRWWKPMLWALVGWAVAFVLPPLVFSDAGVQGIWAWVPASLDWSSDHSVAVAWPTNASIARGLYVLVAGVADACGATPSPLVLARVTTIAAFALVAAALILIAWRARSVERVALVAVALACASLGAPISYAYYLAFALPVCAIIVAFGLRTREDQTGFVSRAPRTVLLIATCLSLTPLLIPWSGPTLVDPGPVVIVGSLVPVLASLAWTTMIVVVCLRAMSTLRRG